jgi:hypothetical protein
MQTEGEKIPPVLYVENPWSLVLTITQLMLEHTLTHSSTHHTRSARSFKYESLIPT